MNWNISTFGRNMLGMFIGLGMGVAQAAPFPNGVALGIDAGSASSPNIPCVQGSCFGMEVAPGFNVWTDFAGGLDGGFILGKNQASGGQETAPSAYLSTPGELTNAWFFFGNYGTFYTSPNGGAENFFDSASCSKATCVGVTELRVFNTAWNSNVIPLGSAAGCTLPSCTPDQLAGIFVDDYTIDLSNFRWSLNYSSVVGSGGFLGVKFQMVIRGPVSNIDGGYAPTARSIKLDTMLGETKTWTPIAADINNDPLTCRIGTQPTRGTATVATDCSSGTYTPNTSTYGFFDEFTYLANDGTADSNVAKVSVTVLAPYNSPPVASDLSYSTKRDIPVQWMPAVSDVDGDTLTCGITTQPKHGLALMDANCSSGTYYPNPGYVGTDTFNYIANDGTANSNIATVTITVNSLPCTELYPATYVSTDGAGGGKPVNMTVSATFIGNIAPTNSTSRYKVCANTSVDYTVHTNAGGITTCTLDSRLVPNTGLIAMGSSSRKLVCKNATTGDADTYSFSPN